MINKHYYAPKQLAGLTVNPSLHFVYLAGCDSGTLRQEWEKAFAPAHVYTYDRLTAVAEHAWWLWTEGPEAVRELP
ncbi:MAG: hypothetical protein HYV26_06305 [Candidatus Hydrogenedentes bacterium]|nr:hypothetical protein [Candidatus Hydrogenedentota bacterium]